MAVVIVDEGFGLVDELSHPGWRFLTVEVVVLTGSLPKKLILGHLPAFVAVVDL